MMNCLEFREDGKLKRVKIDSSILKDPVRQLQFGLDVISKPYPRCDFKLSLANQLITKPMLALLVQILNQEPYTTTESSSTSTTPTTTKWKYVRFFECLLALPDATFWCPLKEELRCSPDDVKIFVSTLSLRTTSLDLCVCDCPDILHALCDAPNSKVEISIWKIEKLGFSTLDCTRLANILQRTEYLILNTKYIEDPLVLAEGLVNLKGLNMGWKDNDLPARTNYQYPLLLGDVSVGEGGNSMFQGLLSPCRQLTDLCLKNVQLDDCHFMALVDMLPTSQVEELILHVHDVSWEGIMAFAHQLPLITCLKTLVMKRLKQVHQIVAREECCMAWIQGMRGNYSIENMYIDFITQFTTVVRLVYYYADLNHAGRRILVTSNPVPAGLWPRILERAGTMPSQVLDSWTFGQIMRGRRRVDKIYFLLRNCCPALLTRTRAQFNE